MTQEELFNKENLNLITAEIRRRFYNSPIADVEDAVQDACIKIMKDHKEEKTYSIGYFYNAVYFSFINNVKAKQSYKKMEQRLVDDIEKWNPMMSNKSISIGEVSIPADLLKKEEFDDLMESLESTDPRYKVATLFVLSGYSIMHSLNLAGLRNMSHKQFAAKIIQNLPTE